MHLIARAGSLHDLPDVAAMSQPGIPLACTATTTACGWRCNMRDLASGAETFSFPESSHCEDRQVTRMTCQLLLQCHNPESLLLALLLPLLVAGGATLGTSPQARALPRCVSLSGQAGCLVRHVCRNISPWRPVHSRWALPGGRTFCAGQTLLCLKYRICLRAFPSISHTRGVPRCGQVVCQRNQQAVLLYQCLASWSCTRGNFTARLDSLLEASDPCKPGSGRMCTA